MDYSQIALYLLGAAITFFIVNRAMFAALKGRIMTIGIWKRLGIRHLAVALVCVYLFVETVSALYPMHAAFRFSLMGWLFGGDGYNVAFAPAIVAGENGGALGKVFAIAFLSALTVAMPSFNVEEEKAFRQGKNLWNDIPIQSAVFGAIHITAGVPVAICVALMLVGVIWHIAYKLRYDKMIRFGFEKELAELEATFESAAHHNAFNNLGLATLAFFLIWK
ncbi:MAG: tetratricopeptide repeat protein [Patescibacteria group bacterium]|nr:tetratricopeptide repeat protein [Patescibacteria group bacterium]